jgi:hypothetical protein
MDASLSDLSYRKYFRGLYPLAPRRRVRLQIASMYANAVYGICARSDVPTVIGIDLRRVKVALGAGIILTAPFGAHTAQQTLLLDEHPLAG